MSVLLWVSNNWRKITCKLFTLPKDERSHVNPIWFLLDWSDIILNTGKESIRAKRILVDSGVGICIDDQTSPFSFVVVDGTMEISNEPD